MNWLCIACQDHVQRGLAGGFMQVCHGKGGPLRRIAPGDTVIYYSPTTAMGIRDGLMRFTAIGTALPGDPYQADMGDGFHPYRRDVAWAQARSTPIRPLLDALELTRGRSNWAYPFRFGILPLADGDRDRIAEAMQAGAPLPNSLPRPMPLPRTERCPAPAGAAQSPMFPGF